MFFPIIFVISGLMIVALIGAKIIEDKKKTKPLFLRMVSLGDERVRNMNTEFAHKYSNLKERAYILVTKQAPLHARNLLNKIIAQTKERFEKHVGDIRGSKLLKKSDGISEYFKSISEKENGRVDDTVEVREGSQENPSKVE